MKREDGGRARLPGDGDVGEPPQNFQMRPPWDPSLPEGRSQGKGESGRGRDLDRRFLSSPLEGGRSGGGFRADVRAGPGQNSIRSFTAAPNSGAASGSWSGFSRRKPPRATAAPGPVSAS